MELKNLGQTAASALIHTDIRLEREHWTMFRNKLLGIAAAATLGSAAMLGSTAAHAVKICDTAPANRAALTADGGDCSDGVTFAKETLLMGSTNVTASNDTSDTTPYFNINDELFLGASSDVGATATSDYTVTITLDGMVFRSAAVLTGSDSAVFNRATGGASGDNMVVFELTSGFLDSATGHLSLDADFAVSAEGGSATLTMMNRVAGVSETHGPVNVIMVAAALDETASPMSPTADVSADGFLTFVGARTTASLGTLELGVKAMHRAAAGDGTGDNPTAGAAVSQLSHIMLVGDNTATPPAPNSTVSFMGDFSFTSRVFLHGDDDCGAALTDAHSNKTADGSALAGDTDLAAAETDLRVMQGTGDNAVITGTTSKVTVGTTAAPTFTTPQHLCIMVDGETPIPSTSAYTAMGSYMGLANAALGPMPAQQTLGMINRNGTTVRLPYLSTHAKFHQRIRMVNRGTVDADYRMVFHGDGDVAGPDAMGTLEAGTITVLSLGGDNDQHVVTPANGNNTSGTVIIDALPSVIDVATTQVTRATGASDTVVYTAE